MPLLFALAFLLQTPAAQACADVADCRTQAEAAAAQGDFESFHDLAWRTVQKGRHNDTDLMYLLARAQCLSGRPDDALVMLERIVDLGGTPDVAANPDFVWVRQLARWPELAAKLGLSPAAAAAARSASPGPPAAPAPPAAEASAGAAPAGSAASSGSESGLSFEAPDGLSPVALGHDAVSRRFLLADRAGARLVIVDEVSHHVVNYASAATAGFYGDLTGFAIDARRGDLWVVSAKGDGAGAASTLHKLQLVSGRTLMEVRLPDRVGPVTLVAVAVAPDGTVYAIDAIESRLLRVRPGARALEVVTRLDVHNPTALTAPEDRVLYVASDDGLDRVDLASNKSARVKSVEPLTRFLSLAWRNGGVLVGVERVADSYLVVRVALDQAGTRAEPRAILAASPQPIVGTLTPDGYYYLSAGSIRFVKVK